MNKKHKVLIIEDEVKSANLLVKMIQLTFPNIDILQPCYDLVSGIKSIKENYPDLLLLDVELPEHSGLQLFDMLECEYVTFSLIFTTASTEHALKAFEMSAIDYLVKPIQIDKLIQAINKSLFNEYINRSQIQPFINDLIGIKNKKLVLPVHNGYEIIDILNICYVAAEGSYTRLSVVESSEVIVSKNLKYFEESLCKEKLFMRVHRSYIVNLSFIKKIVRDEGCIIILKTGVQIPVTPDKLNDLTIVLQKGV